MPTLHLPVGRENVPEVAGTGNQPADNVGSNSSVIRVPPDQQANAQRRLENFTRFQFEGRAFYNEASSSADALEALLGDISSLDIDAGPARAKIYAHGSGGIRVKELIPALKQARARLKEAGYKVKPGWNSCAIWLSVEYK